MKCILLIATNLRWWKWQLSTCGTRNMDPRSSWTATHMNTSHLHTTKPHCKVKPPGPPIGPHPHRIDRGGQQVFPLRLPVLSLLLVGAVLFHGLPAGEVDDAAGSLLPLRSLVFPLQLTQLHALEVLPRVWALTLGETSRTDTEL